VPNLMVEVLLVCGHLNVIEAVSVMSELLPKQGEPSYCSVCKKDRQITGIGDPYWEFLDGETEDITIKAPTPEAPKQMTLDDFQ